MVLHPPEANRPLELACVVWVCLGSLSWTHQSVRAAEFAPFDRANSFSEIVEPQLSSTQLPSPSPSLSEPAMGRLQTLAPPFEEFAQIPENPQDRFIQSDPNPPQPLEPETSPTVETQPPVQPEPSESPANIEVLGIELIGSTLFSTEDFAAEIEPLTEEGKATREQLESLADRVTERYLAGGYITSRAILDSASLASGQIKIQVLEGRIERIEVEGSDRLENYARDRVSLGASAPVRASNLEEQLRLLRTDPLFDNVEASLRSGETVGSSILIVRVTPTNPFNASTSIDNYSPPSVGSERFSLNGTYRNALGLGDILDASLKSTLQGGSRTIDVSYRVPLNPTNGTLQLRTSVNWNNVIQGVGRIFDISGQSQLYEINYRQPLIRTPREELALSVGFAYQTGQTFTFAGPFGFGFGPDSEGVSTTSTFKFGQEYVLRDVTGAWAARSLFNFGTGLFDATSNPGPIPDGHYASWLFQAQRVQVLDENNFLIISADLQLANDGLLPSQQFVIGGGQSVRGFRQNARAGDNGFRFSVEDRITLQRDEAGIARFLFIPFVDLGWVWNAGDNPNALPDKHFLAGIGAGFVWQPLERLSIKLDYGIPLVNLPDRGTNAQDDGFYFSVLYEF
ncbi:MAG: ShlB/FhaC/HecB family hemolysin secretion/activation protein [Cyanobacteriota bacterium]|nr:ShlB/FhaC/HecB family hemolysin secretion/activation protein [Cyanobacteriota bacterium]